MLINPLKPRERERKKEHNFVRWFPNSKLLLHASHAALLILNSSKLPAVVDAADLIVFLNYR
jgi:hypothetical protein